MNPPKRIRIGAAQWTVKTMPEIDTSDDKLGLCVNRRSEIHLAEGQSASSLRDSMLHELLHALLYESGLAHAMGIGDDDEERMIRILTPTLLQVLRTNPQLIDYLRS